MADDATLPLPDPELTARVLEALENGTPAEVGALRRVVPADDTELRAALAAVQGYRAHLQAERQRPRAAAASADGELEPGTRISDFVIEGRIGAGAMGVVYRARQVSLGDRTVALKVLPRALLARDRRFADRFRREASLAATIHHPNLAEVYGFEESEDTLCFAMRLVEGRTLHDVLTSLAQQHRGAVRASSPAHVRSCATLARDLAGALAAIHAEGLVHRDVKPSNIVLERAAPNFDEEALTARPVLVDFGLLRPQGDTEITGTRTMLGTPAYASHEIQLGRDIDGRADVFALGAVLHDLLTLTPPGERGPATSGLPAVRTINPTVDLRLAAIVDMALQERRELRYANGGALKEELDRYLRGEPVHALPTGGVGRLRLWARRNPAGAAKGTLAVVFAVLLVALLTWVGGWAWSTSRLATEAVRAEVDGDLTAAATAYRALAGTANASLLWWLHDDLDRAALYAEDNDHPFVAAIGHFRDGANALAGNGSTTIAPEHDFARGADRLKYVLFGPDEPVLGEVARRTLLREARSGAPEFRRRIGMDAWTDYLSLQHERRTFTAELPDVLRRALADRGLRPYTRQAAVAALGTIPTRDALAEVIERLVDPDPAVARKARVVAIEQYDWMHRYGAETEYRRLDAQLMADWACRHYEWATRMDGPGGLENAEPPEYDLATHMRLACYEDPLGAAPPSRRLAVPAAVRELIDHAHDGIREFLSTNPDLEDDRDDANGGSMLATYRYATGRAVLHHDPTIWQPHLGDLTPTMLVTRQPDADSRLGLLDFWWQEPDQPTRATGTIVAASCTAAERRLDCRNHPLRPQHLRMLHPGYSSLRVRTVVPVDGDWTSLTVSLFHTVGTRATLRNQGMATCRLGVEGEACSVITEVSSGSGTCLLAVPADMLRRHDELELVVEYLHGNTSYWIRRIELEWGQDPYLDRNRSHGKD